jgi:hypothetical protein
MRALLVLAAVVNAVDRSKFRTCEQAAFCNRHRGKAAEPEVRARRRAFHSRRAPERR